MKYSIFDVDGTILDSMKIWDVLASRTVRSLSKVPEANLDQIVAKMSLEESSSYIKEHYQLSCSKAQIKAEVLKQLATFYREEVQLKPGFKDFISYFDSRNVIATTSDKALVQQALQRLGIDAYFEKIFTCTEIGKSKKEPDIYLACAQYFHQKPENVFVFEDASHCIRTAKKAGFQVVGVQDSEDISSDCDGYIEDWRQIGGTTLCRDRK